MGRMNYEDFLKRKLLSAESVGFTVTDDTINEQLFPFQRDIVRWALQRGRAAVFADCGLGKTPIQLEWARHVCEQTGGNVLILAPLAVSSQTVREGEKFGISVRRAEYQSDSRPGITITNYERLHHFDSSQFAGIVLDESSILKAFDGKTRKLITEFSERILYRLACTATPAPNDLIELSNHAEFLGILRRKEIVALFFTQDGNTSSQFRLKGHARNGFWRWLASWAVALRAPSDLGYDDDDFVLPELKIRQLIVDPGKRDRGLFSEIFGIEANATTLSERRTERRVSLDNRVDAVAEIVSKRPNEQWLIWCDLNAESEALTRSIPNAVEVRGSDSAEYKERMLLGFSSGSVRVLVTKPSIAGWGMNWQNCAHVVFVGLSDSYEQYYQAVRRCWRFGQKREVRCFVVTARTEGAVVQNIQRKETQAREMFSELTQHMRDLSIGQATREELVVENCSQSGDGWTMMLGDCIDRIAEIEDNSIGLSVFSPPFPGMYVYSNSVRDMGNVQSIEEFIHQFGYLAPELLRVTMPGRNCAIHLTQAVATLGGDGYIGIKDFRGEVIRAMEHVGWFYYGEVCIDKNPQLKAVRTHDRGLLFKSLAQDSSVLHPALADYVLQFRKPGDNPHTIKAGRVERYGNTTGWITTEEWIEWAAPVWYRADRGIPGGIRETDVLNVVQARETDDERHLAPLQLGVIERCVKLWSAPGDLVLSPFAGIGSEGFVSIKLNRRFVGIELKKSYWESALRNLKEAERLREKGSLWEELFGPPDEDAKYVNAKPKLDDMT